MAGSQRMAVVGIGLNVLPQATAELSWGYGCLQELEAGQSAPRVLARVAAALVQALLRFERAGFAPSQAGFERRDVLRGRSVSTTLPGLPEGIADGVDGGGTLWLRVNGERVPVASGEVSLRLLPGPAPTPEPGAAGNQAGAPC